MSIRTYLKAAAVALPLAFGGVKATAQSAQGVLKSAEKVVTTDTLKTMDQKAVDARTLLLKRYKGHFQGDVKNGRISNGSLDYKEAGKTVPAASVVNANSSAVVTAEGSYVHGSKLAGAGYRLRGAVEKNHDTFDATAIFAKGNKKSDMVGDFSYTRNFPLTNGLNATGKLGAEGVAHKVNGGDSYGTMAPHLTAGLKYQHAFDNGVKLGAKGEVGGAMPFNFKSETLKKVESPKFVANAEVEAGYKNVSAFVNGGKDAILGNNIGGGVRINF